MLDLQVGYAPATVQLSAMGFFDGTETGGVALFIPHVPSQTWVS